ncbi:S-layer homology domain-containing protein [Patescibacteria group bacterium]|nr:S-layer homology domain-containing protein [Patescibacteria group bacterium]
MNKLRIISLVCALALVLLNSVGVSAMYAEKAALFGDVSSSSESYEAVKYLKDTGVVEGYDDGDFKPHRTINRAEFLKIVMESYGYDVSNNKNCFNDVKDEWFAPYVCKAQTLGLIKGYDDGFYRPNREINFAEASKVVAEAFRLESASGDPAVWYEQYVKSLETLAAIPTSVDSLDKKITRGEMAEIVWRIKAKKKTKATNTYMKLKGEVSQSGEVNSLQIQNDGDGEVSWTIDGYSSQGFKVVWSMNEGPTYPLRNGDKYNYYSDAAVRDSELSAFDGSGTYYVRVCEYLGGKCGVYSNEIEVELEGDVDGSEDDAGEDDAGEDDAGEDDAGEDDAGEDDAGDVEFTSLVDNGDWTVTWGLEGTSDNGFKLVWSKTPGATYPGRDEGDTYNYQSDSATRTAELSAFDGNGTYYVRVCEYLGGACGEYSEEISVELVE